MAKNRPPITPAIRFIKKNAISFTPYLYPFEEKGGTRHAADYLNLTEHHIIKTLVLENEDGTPFIMLMHGDREVSTKQLARVLGVKRVRPCDPSAARRHTGYQVGGISPFGMQTPLPVYAEASIFQLDKLYINGGKRGFLVEIAAGDLMKTLNPALVEAAV